MQMLFATCDAVRHDCICASHMEGDKLFELCRATTHICICHYDPHNELEHVRCLSSHHECCCDTASRCKSYLHLHSKPDLKQETLALQAELKVQQGISKRHSAYITVLENALAEMIDVNLKQKTNLELYTSFIKMSR